MAISGSSFSLPFSGRVEVGRGGPCLNFINERRELYMYKPKWQNKCNRQAQRRRKVRERRK
jgi:hypothetical protein